MRKNSWHSEKTRRKIGEKSKGRIPTEKTRHKMSISQKRAGKDPELRRRRSENAKKAEARKRAEEGADPKLAMERAEARSEAVKRGWKNRSRKVSKETRKKLSKAGKRRFQDPKEREKVSKRFKGVKKLPEHTAKIQASRKGWRPTKTQRENMRQAQQKLRTSGYVLPNRKGTGNSKLNCRACKDKFPHEEILKNDRFCDDCITHTKLCNCGCGDSFFRYNKDGSIRRYTNFSHRTLYVWEKDPERRKQLSERMSGKGNYAWKGGVSFEPYDSEFNNTKKEDMRTRQHHCCADEDETRNTHGETLCVHHVDEDKQNSHPSNLIALCQSHHGRSHNPKARRRHKAFVKALMKEETG